MLALGQWLALAYQSSGKALAIGVDYADQIAVGYAKGYLYNEPRIRGLIRTFRRFGFGEVYWRVSAVGTVTYRSKVMTPMDGARLTNPSFSPAGLILKQCDPLAVAIDEAHRQGLKLYAYITLFDFAFPGLESRFFQRHPEFWSRLAGVVANNVAQDLPGTKELAEFSATLQTGGYSKLLTEGEANGTAPYIRGVPSYGYAEVRAHVLAQVRELIGYRPDGIYFDVSRTHSGIYPVLSYGWHPQWTNPHLKYGYNEPEVALYRKLYGKNPPVRGATSLQSLTGTEEEENWNAVRGHFLTEFLREAARLVHAEGLKVAVGFSPATYNYFQPGSHTRQQLGRIRIDWRKWAEERLIDVIRLNVDHRKHGYDDWVDHSAATYRHAQDRGVRVYVDCSIDGSFDKLKNPPDLLPIREAVQPDLFYRIITETTRNILNSSADGVFYYEAADNTDNLYEAIRKGSGR